MLRAAHVLCLATPASAAPAQAVHLARVLDATLHVMPVPSAGGAAMEQDELRTWIAELAASNGASVPFQVVEDPPESVSAVLQYVDEAKIDLVVVDTPSDRGPVPPLAADNTQALVERLDCPLFVTGHMECPASIDDLLVPTDLSDHALQAFGHAVDLAREYDATVHVLHVVDSLPYVALTRTDRLSLGPTPLSEHRGRRRVREFLRGAEVGDVPVQVHLAYGDPADQVVRFVDRGDADLLVLASHGTGDRSRSPLGQVAERILGRATCPLFLLRAFGASLHVQSSDAASESSAA